MHVRGRRLLVCNCEKTMPLDSEELSRAISAAGGEGELNVHSQLCRAQLDNFERALATGEPLLIACTARLSCPPDNSSTN